MGGEGGGEGGGGGEGCGDGAGGGEGKGDGSGGGEGARSQKMSSSPMHCSRDALW